MFTFNVLSRKQVLRRYVVKNSGVCKEPLSNQCTGISVLSYSTLNPTGWVVSKGGGPAAGGSEKGALQGQAEGECLV